MTLHIYSNLYCEQVVSNLKNNDYLVVSDLFSIDIWVWLLKHRKINTKINIITISELLKGELDSMKFDYIVGNPPYQYPKGSKDNSAKLYIDITKKVLRLLKHNGKLNFITPQAIIIESRLNNLPGIIDTHLKSIDFDADNRFNIGQKVCSWFYDCSYNEHKIQIISNNKKIFVDSIYKAASSDNILLKSITNKVSYKRNNRNKLKIIQTADKDYVKKEHISKECNTHKYEILSSKKYKMYTDKEHFFKNPKSLIIPFIGNIKNNIIISEICTDKEFFITKVIYSDEELENMKKYIESKLIMYCIVNYKRLKPSMGNIFLRELSEIDFSKSYTNQELYKEFNLTNEEINEVQNWYSNYFK